jgi:hypothetical protein
MKTLLPPIGLLFVSSLVQALPAADAQRDWSPPAEERQLPRKMRSAMAERSRESPWATPTRISSAPTTARCRRPWITSPGLGGGVVEIGPGDYLMRDSLHLRSYVTVRGTPGLDRPAPGGRRRVPPGDRRRFRRGTDHGHRSRRASTWGAAMARSGANVVNGFHVTVARIIGRNGSTLALDRPLNSDCTASDGARAATVFPGGERLRPRRGAGRAPRHRRATASRILTLDGCRGGGIFLYRGFGTVIDHCTVRNYAGDGISFQQSNDVLVERAV